MLKRKILFWITWIPLSPLVVSFFIFSDVMNRRRHPTWWVKTEGVRWSVYERFVLLKHKRGLQGPTTSSFRFKDDPDLLRKPKK